MEWVCSVWVIVGNVHGSASEKQKQQKIMNVHYSLKYDIIKSMWGNKKRQKNKTSSFQKLGPCEDTFVLIPLYILTNVFILAYAFHSICVIDTLIY